MKSAVTTLGLAGSSGRIVVVFDDTEWDGSGSISLWGWSNAAGSDRYYASFGEKTYTWWSHNELGYYGAGDEGNLFSPGLTRGKGVYSVYAKGSGNPNAALDNNSTYAVRFFRGGRSSEADWLDFDSNREQPFCVGYHGVSDWGLGQEMRGKIAEVRVYPDNLSSLEAFAMECSLAAHYAIPLRVDGPAAADLSAATHSGFEFAPVAMGFDYRWGPQWLAPGGFSYGEFEVAASSKSMRCDNLAVAFADPESVTRLKHTLVYCASNGEGGSDTAWCLVGQSDARAIPLALSFDPAAYDGIRHPVLYFRASSADEWAELEVEPVQDESGLSFLLPANWQNGQYKLGKRIRGLSVILR